MTTVPYSSPWSPRLLADALDRLGGGARSGRLRGESCVGGNSRLRRHRDVVRDTSQRRLRCDRFRRRGSDGCDDRLPGPRHHRQCRGRRRGSASSRRGSELSGGGIPRRDVHGRRSTKRVPRHHRARRTGRLARVHHGWVFRRPSREEESLPWALRSSQASFCSLGSGDRSWRWRWQALRRSPSG